MTIKTATLDNTLCDERFKSFDLESCLENIDSETLKVIEIIKKESRNINIKYENGEVILSEYKPQCPHCNSIKVIIHQIQSRKLHFYHVHSFKVKIYRYKCHECGKTFMTNLESIVRQSANFTNDLCEKLVEEMCETESSLYATKYRWEAQINTTTKYKSLISHQTIQNILISTAKEIKPFNNLSSMGYLIFDVQWIKLRRKWKYRFALYDVYSDRIIAEEIYDRETRYNISEFLTKNTRNITVKAITTDLDKKYEEILENLNYKHQFCLFHTKKTINNYINRKLKKLKKSQENTAQKITQHLFTAKTKDPATEYKKYQEYTQEINKYKTLKKTLYQILDEKDYEKGLKQLHKLTKHINDYKGPIKRFIKNKLNTKYHKFKQYLQDNRIEKTSNKIENIFSKTMSKKYKRKYRTPQGILTRIHLNEIRYEKNKSRRKYYATT